MGVNLKSIIPSKEIELVDIAGKKVAVDAFNNLFQYLTIIRDRMTGEPLRDSKGRVTSHLSGLFYRTTNWMEFGIRPIFCFDGTPPAFKKKTIEEREEFKRQAEKKYKEAIEKGEPAYKYAQVATRMTNEMLEDSKKLLELMGIPWIQAPSEGEMQCSHMCKNGVVWATVSQDMDCLLDGSTRLVRNLSTSGKRKLPNKEVYVDVKPELIVLNEVLSTLGISQEQLVMIGILTGTDYNPGIMGVGAKTALKLVKENQTLERLIKKIDWNLEVSAQEIYEFFLNPPVTDKYNLEWKEPKTDKIIEFMVNEHDFSRERVEKVLGKLQEGFSKGKQSTLKGWLGK